MKNYFKFVLTFLFVSIVAFYSCSDNSQEPPPPETTTKDYFPNNNGSEYLYELEIVDSSSNIINGERRVSYNGTQQISNSAYQILIDRYDYSLYSITDSAYFNKSSLTLNYNADNSQAMMLVPDSLRSLVQSDKEACMLQFPLVSGKIWSVYKFGVNYGFFVFNIINVSAQVEKFENITLNLNNVPVTVEAIKLKYQMAIAMDPYSAPIYYYADAWMIENIGLVKLEGNSEAINFMIGNNLFAPGSQVKQTLKQYLIP